MKIWKHNTIIDKDVIITLGLESSCDDTSISVLRGNADNTHTVLSNVVKSHCMNDYGGVIPEYAARSHSDYMPSLCAQALAQANLTLADIDLIGFTHGPGLMGGLIVSTTFGKMLASILRIPIVAVNHLEGHIFSPALEHNIQFPFLTLLITGGHSQMIVVNNINNYNNLGGTVDDAVGEAFDKVARMLGFGYPGGKIVEQMAQKGDHNRFALPKPMHNSKDCNFSCSGLKTAVKLIIDKFGSAITEQDISDICAAFQHSITDLLIIKLKQALNISRVDNLAIVGGVAANRFIRQAVYKNFAEYNIYFPSMEFCTDNAAMIALAAYKKLKIGYCSGLSVSPNPALSLTDFDLD